MIVLVVALSAAAEAAGPGAELRARLFGWPALAVPAGVLVASVRGRTERGSRADPVLVVLGLLLAVGALIRMRVVIGSVLGVG